MARIANDAGEHEALVAWLGGSPAMLGNETSCMRTATLDRSRRSRVGLRLRRTLQARRRMDACLDAAERRQNGNGVPVDMKLALQNYQAACRLSNAPSCFRAAKILRSGDGVKADPKAAAVWYDKACQMRQTRACAILGEPVPARARGVRRGRCPRQVLPRRCLLERPSLELHPGPAARAREPEPESNCGSGDKIHSRTSSHWRSQRIHSR